MAKPMDPKRTAGVSASVAVAPAVSSDGAGGGERARSITATAPIADNSNDRTALQ